MRCGDGGGVDFGLFLVVDGLLLENGADVPNFWEVLYVNVRKRSDGIQVWMVLVLSEAAMVGEETGCSDT